MLLSDQSLNPCLTIWRISIRLAKLVIAWFRETSSRIDQNALFANERLQHHRNLITSSRNPPGSRECDHCAAESLLQIHIERQVIVSRTYCVASMSVNRRHSTPRPSYYKYACLALLLLGLLYISSCTSQHSRTTKATLVHRSRSYNIQHSLDTAHIGFTTAAQQPRTLLAGLETQSFSRNRTRPPTHRQHQSKCSSAQAPLPLWQPPFLAKPPHI